VENRIYEDTKVGDVFVTTTHFDTSAQVAIHKGYGTWAREAEGRAIVGYSSQADSPEWTKINGNLYGEDKHMLTEAELGKHVHRLAGSNWSPSSRDLQLDPNQVNLSTKTLAPVRLTSIHDDRLDDNYTIEPTDWASAGNDEPHNNVQLSKVYNVWRRIA